MKKVFLKRTADILEKSAIASAAVGIFQEKDIGLWIAMVSVALCYLFTYMEEKK